MNSVPPRLWSAGRSYCVGVSFFTASKRAPLPIVRRLPLSLQLRPNQGRRASCSKRSPGVRSPRIIREARGISHSSINGLRMLLRRRVGKWLGFGMNKVGSSPRWRIEGLPSFEFSTTCDRGGTPPSMVNPKRKAVAISRRRRRPRSAGNQASRLAKQVPFPV